MEKVNNPIDDHENCLELNLKRLVQKRELNESDAAKYDELIMCQIILIKHYRIARIDGFVPEMFLVRE